MKSNYFLKKACLASVLSIAALQTMQAQDIITKRTGENLKTRVLEITVAEVKYKDFDRMEGPIYTLAKADVLLIQYEDSTKEAFTMENDAPKELLEVESNRNTSASMYAQGQQDAGIYYDGYRGARTGTLVTSLLSPLVGLIPAIACSTTTPKEKNLDFPSHDLMKNPDYKNGYMQQSRKIKSNKVWGYWGVGLGVNIVAVLLMKN